MHENNSSTEKKEHCTEMARAKKAPSEASESKQKSRKQNGETSGAAGQTISKKLQQKMDGKTTLRTGPVLPTTMTKSSVGKRSGPGSILHYIYQSTLGQSLHSQMRQCLQKPFVRTLSSYTLHRTASPFDRRVTCLAWHPSHPTTLAVGSKGGDVVLWDYSVINKTSFIQGVRIT